MNHSIEKERIVHLINSSEPKDSQLLTKAESVTNLQFNLQYSLRLIEASTDYLLMTSSDNEHINEPGSEISQEFISRAYLNDESGKLPCTKEMIKELLKDHERIIHQLEKRIELSDTYLDSEIVEFVHSIIEEHQNIAGKFRRSF